MHVTSGHLSAGPVSLATLAPDPLAPLAPDPLAPLAPDLPAPPLAPDSTAGALTDVTKSISLLNTLGISFVAQ